MVRDTHKDAEKASERKDPSLAMQFVSMLSNLAILIIEIVKLPG